VKHYYNINQINRRVAKTKLKNGFMVSTVFLGIDHNFSGQENPLLFETMVFPSEENFKDLECERYSTKEQAVEGHKKMVRKWEKESDNQGWT